MMLEHNTYREAISDVKLPDDVGMEIMEGAIRRKEQRTQKLRARAIAAIAATFIIAFGANGICYAQTGMNIWDLLGATYHKTEEATAANLAEGFQKSGQTITYGNLQFTLEYYYFDPINCEAYYSIRTDSLDGTPLNLENIADSDISHEWTFGSSPNRKGGFEPGGWTSNGPISPSYVNDAHTAIQMFYHDVYTYENEGSPEDTMEVFLNVRDGEEVENGITYYKYKKAEGSFLLKPTGQLKSLYADGSSMDGCTTIKVTTGGICLYFHNNIGYDPEEYPFHLITLKMKDGTNYYVFDAPPEGWEPLDREALDASGNFQDTGYRTPDGEEIPRESILGQFSGGGGGGGKYMWNYDFSGTFNSLINVDDIAGIYVDGVEMPLM